MGEYEYTEFVKIPLPSGSLLLMEGAAQLDWQVCMCHLYRAVSYENILLIDHNFRERGIWK